MGYIAHVQRGAVFLRNRRMAAFRASLGLFLSLLVLHAAAPGGDPRGPGTLSMAQRLERLAARANPANNRFLSAQRAENLLQAAAQITDPDKRDELSFLLGTELLNAGRNSEALQQFDRLEQSLKERNPHLLRRNLINLRVDQALCWLRMGEWTNCLADHNAESCLAPIQGRGIHRFQEGSRRAIGILTKLLEEYPDNRMGQWLLNIASMTVGEYPEKVPARWLIPPGKFASEYEMKRFPEIAGKVGLDPMELSGGSIVEDFDGDGNLDVICSSIGLRDQLRFYHNNGDGSFTERTAEAGLLGEVGGLNLIQGDFNNDGYMDVLVLRGAWMRNEGRFPKSLLRNNGNGTFEDVTDAAGLLSLQPSQTAVWFDYDGDGWLDLFLGNESLGKDGHRCQLFHNNRDGTFSERAVESGVGYVGYVKGVCTADYDHDGRPDLYLSVLGQPNVLYHNDGLAGTNSTGRAIWKFSDKASVAHVTEPLYSFPCFFFDYDNDGWEDLCVTGYHIENVGDVCADYLGLPHQGERARLYRNNRDGTFQNVTREMGLDRLLHAMGCNYGDLDNDGYLDFYLGTGDPDLATIIPNRMFRNDAGRRFQDVTTAGGFGHLQKGHGISFADLDNDGDQDVYEDMGGAVSSDVYHNVLYENPGSSNHWVTLKLEGVQSNRAAIGARIRVMVDTAEGERSVYKTVSTGASFGSSPLRQEIGLGQARAIRRIEIFWPVTGKTQALSSVALDHFYQVREGDPGARAWHLNTFKLGANAKAAQAHEHHSH